MAKWMLEWTELINNIDDKIAASGQDWDFDFALINPHFCITYAA